MTRVIYYTATTIDGYLATEDDSLDWLFATPGGEDAGASFRRFLDRIGVIVQGATTYEWVLANERLIEQPEKWPAYYGDRPTYVFTSRLLPRVRGADVRLVSGNVRQLWPDIRDTAGSRDVWIVGGGDLAGQFDDEGLLDEIHLSVAPATLGAGKPLLPRVVGPNRLALTHVARSGQFAELVYAVARGSSGQG